jgi:hypothetical protein
MNLVIVIFLIYAIVCCLLYIAVLRGFLEVNSMYGDHDENMMRLVFVFGWPIWLPAVIYKTIGRFLKGEKHG